MAGYLVQPNPKDLEECAGLTFPVEITVNGQFFQGKEKIYVDIDNGIIKVDGDLVGIFKGSVVVARRLGIMKIV